MLPGILNLFCVGTRMMTNEGKSITVNEDVEMEVCLRYKSIFLFTTLDLDNALNYLGFWLNPVSYSIKDWDWLIRKCEKIE